MRASSNGKTAFAITVAFDLRPGERERFMPLIEKNAADSMRFEQGCLRFDVLIPLREGPDVLLYEVYRTKGDFDAHLESEHFKQFDRETRDMVVAKTIVEFSVTENSKAIDR